MKRLFALPWAILAGILAFGAAFVPFQSRPAQAEELTVGMSQYPPNFHPNIEAVLAKTYILSATMRPFTVHNHDWEGICRLCNELPTIENGLAVPEDTPEGGKGIALTFKINPQATWGDGTPVTSADALLTWEIGRHPQSGISNSELYRRILSLDVIDAKTFVLHVDRISFDYSLIHDFQLVPAHLERPLFEADPVQYRHRTTFDSDPTNPGLAFGPYRITEVIPGSKVVVERNETWWGRKPAFDRITFKIIENTAALEANLLSGSVDMIAGELGLSFDQALAFEKRHGASYDIIFKSGLIYEHIDMNLDNPLLQDKRMRLALIHALDREAVSSQLFQGKQPVAHASVSPLDWVHTDDIPHYAYDPEKAKRLLDELGWSVMKGGIRHNAGGERLALEIMTTAGNRSRELVQQALQSQWRQVGIDVRIKNEPPRVLFGQTLNQRKYSGLAMYAWISSPENVPRTTLHSDQIPTAENGWTGQNTPGFVNAEMDELLEAIETELDRDKREKLWHRLQRLYAEELPVMPLYWRANAFILPKWLKGVRPTGHQGVTTLWVEEWTTEGR